MHSSIKKTDDAVKNYVAYLRETEFASHITKPAKPTERPVVVMDQVDRYYILLLMQHSIDTALGCKICLLLPKKLLLMMNKHKDQRLQ